jgi:trk system potassium uptake protein TrkH
MNLRIVIQVLGNLLMLESVGLVPPLLISLYYHENAASAFALCIALSSIIGFLMFRTPVFNKKIKVKEGFCIVSLGWILVSIFGALPFIFSGSIPSFVDAFFETVSGFTTTGATLVNDIESLPYGILFWRSFTHWIGGMGILVFTLAIFPAIGVGSFQIFKAESPGPIADKIVPRIQDTAKVLYTTYIGLTLLEIILLKLGGMNLFDSTVHTFGTVGTGGFSTKNNSIGAYDSAYIQVVISIFMILSGTSFSLYYGFYRKKWREVLRNEELKLYIGIIFISIVLITFNIYGGIYKSIGKSLQHALFQVSSIITTTGYATVDFDQWPIFSKTILFALMIVGGCAGSTAGGMKNIRILVLLKLIKREFSKILHPRAIIPVKIGNKALSTDILTSISSFSALYILIFFLGTIAISLEGIGLVSASSAVASMLGNVGPGFDFVGPTRNYLQFSIPSKLLLTSFMLLGRLELFTVLILFSPNFWKNK